jgi:hypothetical protein
MKYFDILKHDLKIIEYRRLKIIIDKYRQISFKSHSRPKAARHILLFLHFSLIVDLLTHWLVSISK